MQQHDILQQEILQLKSQILSLLSQSVHSSQHTVLIKLKSIDNPQWLDYAIVHLGPEYQIYLARLTQLEAAISQMEIGLYGICADCEQAIEQQRLAADLATQRCAHCAAKHTEPAC